MSMGRQAFTLPVVQYKLPSFIQSIQLISLITWDSSIAYEATVRIYMLQKAHFTIEFGQVHPMQSFKSFILAKAGSA
jgi:hypothetical protein